MERVALSRKSQVLSRNPALDIELTTLDFNNKSGIASVTVRNDELFFNITP